MANVESTLDDGLTAKGRATRFRIVTTAASLMFERGVAGTSLDDVKAAAGVSSSQLYHYFVDKGALVSAVIASQTEAVLEGQQPLLANLDSISALKAWRNVLIGFRRELRCRGGCPIGSLASELAEADGKARVELATGFRRWEESIRSGLRSMQARGDLTPNANPDNLATALLATVQGGILLTQIQRQTRPMEIAVDTMIDHIESFVPQTLVQRGRRLPRKSRASRA